MPLIRSQILKAIIAEYIGTLILMLIGCSACAAFTLNVQNKPDKVNDTLGITLSWGIAAMVGITASLEISGGHLNPAVTVAMATLRKFEWKYVIPYILAQMLGSIMGSGLAYLCYLDAITEQNSMINETDRIYGHALSTGTIFTTYPASHVTIRGAVIDQIISTASLLFSVMTIGDEKSLNIPKKLQPLILAFVITIHCAAFGYNEGAPLNPARDLGPRILTAFCGWGWDVFKPLNWHYWWMGGIVGPHIGAICGVWIYYLLIECHHNNIKKNSNGAVFSIS